MKKITPQVKAIADAHISARLGNKPFDNPLFIKSEGDMIKAMLEGKIFKGALNVIERNFVPTSSLMLVDMGMTTTTYMNGVRRGFKELFDKASKKGIATEIKEDEIKTAKDTLKANGYYVESLWRVEDVQARFEATDEQAQAVLDMAHKTSTEDFFERIDIVANEFNLTPKKD